jgi:Mg2+ and Co2+ transporter CorA
MAMVHQMWLWVIDDRTVITAGTERMASGDKTLHKFLEDSLQNFTDHLNTNDEAPNRKSKFRPANQLVQELVSRCTHFLDRPNLAGFPDPFFSSFDNVIGGVSARVTDKYTSFRKSLEASEAIIRNSANITINEESELLLDIRDVRDELSMVRNVFCQQRDVLEDMSTEFAHHAPGVHNSVHVSGSGSMPRVSTFLRRLQLIDENAENVEQAIQHLLDLKSQRASLNEAVSIADQTAVMMDQAETLLEQSKHAAYQGKIILVFTIVTVFFTPLSWMSAIFAVDLENGQAYMPWQVVTGELASLALTGVIVLLAFFLFREPKAQNESKVLRCVTES